MHNDNEQPKRPTRNVTWQAQTLPTACEHAFEVIAHEDGRGLKRCCKCGGMETQ